MAFIIFWQTCNLNIILIKITLAYLMIFSFDNLKDAKQMIYIHVVIAIF